MAHVEGKIKFLATKLASLQAELKVSREIMVMASRDVNEMFKKKYFPEVPVKPESIPDETDLDEHAPNEDGDPPPNQEKHQEKEDKNQQDASSEEEIQKLSAKKTADPDVKKLFKKIAAMTHPDKLSSLSEYEKKRKEKLFKKAMLALENNDLVSLADIAMELELDAPDLTKEKLKEAENKIIAIKKELHHIESTYVWRWFFCEDKEEKDKILTELFGIMYANRTRS